MDAMKTAAIIPAGGAGQRMGTDRAKQYLSLADKPILIHTLQVFQDTPLIDEIILVVPPADVSSMEKTALKDYGLSKVRNVVPGGRERQDSVRNGLGVVRDDHDIVVIHDAVRCFVSQELIAAAIDGAAKHKAVTTGVPVRDTVKKVFPDGWVDKTIVRQDLWLTQTPQAFQTDILKKAYEAAYDEGFCGTDDAELVERLGIPVMMLKGACKNIKITTPEDLSFGRSLIGTRE